jgi:hypothetical protein
MTHGDKIKGYILPYQSTECEVLYTKTEVFPKESECWSCRHTQAPAKLPEPIELSYLSIVTL